MSTKRARAIPFITQSPTDPSKYVLGEQAVDMLSGITGKLAVIAVAGARAPLPPAAAPTTPVMCVYVCIRAGKYRTGKSFLLNCLIGRASAFAVGPTVEACTKGIWVYGA